MTAPSVHQIRVGPNAVSEAIGVAHHFAAANEPASEAVLAIIVEELILNLIDHGGAVDGDLFELGLWPSADGVRLMLVDGCTPFDPREAEQADLPNGERGGGAGLAMVRAWSRITSYRLEDGRNVLELIVRADA